MLKLKSEQDDGKHSIQEIRNKFRKKMREEELQSIFAAIREKLIEQSNNQHAPVSRIEQRAPTIIQQPLPPNYYEYMSYAMRMVPVLNYPIYHHNLPLPSPTISPLLPQIDENIYFQKNGFVIYKILLGSGTYAQVWQGKIRATGQKIAAKQVKVLEENQRRCLKELQSQHVVKVIEIFTHLSKSFIILEFCDKNLRQELKECDFKIQMALKYFEQLVEGMDVLQSRNVIHRDLKFQNILVKDSKIKIADFGFAKYLGSELQVESRRCGTPYTMAPEIYFSLSRMASYTIKSDIWSIGVILHEMLYQMHPFHGSSLNFKKEKRAKVMKKYGILDKIIDECLVFNPSLRINWSQFKILFNYYRQEKDYYFCQKQRPLITKLPSSKEKTANQHQRAKKQTVRKQETRMKQRNMKILRQKQQSRDRREDRTPPRRRKYSFEKNLIDKDKFEHPFRQKIHANDVRKEQAQKKVQKKIVENKKQTKLVILDFKEIEQRPLHNEIRPTIMRTPIIQDQQQQSNFRQFWQGMIISLVIVVVILAFLYLKFD